MLSSWGRTPQRGHISALSSVGEAVDCAAPSLVGEAVDCAAALFFFFLLAGLEEGGGGGAGGEGEGPTADESLDEPDTFFSLPYPPKSTQFNSQAYMD